MQSHVQAVDKEIGTLRQRLGLHRPQLTQEQRERFYWALEAEFRGDAADVQRRQSVYRHWLEEAPAGPVLDLGCGRGEWLELLHAWGLQGQGVDASALNVAQGRSRGLQMHEADALVWLAEQADASASAITAFHLAEHLAFDDLHLLVLHAQRVLQPGGMLILETPNPENLGVATETFWLDPTHRRPLPPALLAALARACGLEVVTVLRLNPPEEDPGPVESERLLQALVQGRDCALVARKPGATRE
jgi:O-antigen chain-terminating methyltransferase